MSLAPGTRIGPYEVVGVIGTGGMGEVYRARDTKLKRDVALKVLPERLAQDAERLQRFDREARALAALNHPNIAALYGLEDRPDQAGLGRAIVMELVEGEDLSVRIRRGSLTMTETLAIAGQVAEALAAAHAVGIVHRDLKPANIKVRDDGTVKVLDFGLATGRSTEAGAEAGSGSDSQDLPQTVTSDGTITEEGVVLGTASYMSPEQAKGKVVDKRADIWAFGVVLFEMIAGRRPFGSGDAADTMARVLATEPEWTALPASTPASLRRLLARCLTKDRKHRLHDIADARLELDEARSGRPTAWAEGSAGPERSGWRGIIWSSLAAVGVVAGLAAGWAMWGRSVSAPVVTRARIDVAPASELNAGGQYAEMVLAAGGARTALAWSPNGRTLAFIGVTNGVRQVFLRDLGSDVARPLAGTQRARALTFSPDGTDVAFWADGWLQRMPVTGGPAARICKALSVVNGLHWGESQIVFSQGNLWAVDMRSDAGEARALMVSSELVRQSGPIVLPGGKAILYTEYSRQWTSGDERVMALSLTPGAMPKLILHEAADAHYLSTGHVAFLRQGTLFVVPFDAQTLELRGEPIAVVKDIVQSTSAWDSDDLTLQGQFAISENGNLAYVSGALPVYPNRELVTVDRKGRVTSIGAPPSGYRNHVELSPDGTKLGVTIQTASEVRSFAYDLNRGGFARIAEWVGGEVTFASWSSGDQIAVQVVDAGKITASVVRSDVASKATAVADSVGFWATSISKDGQLIGVWSSDLLVYAPDYRDKPLKWTTTFAAERQPMWSPDGHWVAFTSSTTGRPEVYVRRFPGLSDAISVSTAGGQSPGWNPNGRELFYIEPGDRDRMMSVRFDPSGRAQPPQMLFSFAHDELFVGTMILTPYAAARDGQRFYAVRTLPRATTPITQINVVLNWFEELKARR